MEVNNQDFEIISPGGFLEGIKSLGMTELSETQVSYLLKILSKEELDGNILLQELLTIMENFGLHDEDEQQLPEGYEPQEDSSPSPPKKKKGEADLTKLDNESIEIMAMLMLYCIRNEMEAKQVFESVIFE